MFESVRVEECDALLAAVRGVCERLDPATVPADSVSGVFHTLAAIRRLADAALTRLGPRYERSGAWQDRGAKSAADAIARAVGTSPAESKRRLETGQRLGKCHKVDAALRAGAVSSEQAGVITGAAGDEDGEETLLALARTGSHQQLCDEAARERARADRDEHARRQRQRRLRGVRRWTDADGMYNLHLRALPEHGAEIDARLKPLVDRVFLDARREGRHEPVPAYVADAVVEVLRGGAGDGGRRGRSGQAVRPERKVIALVDIEALNRGRAEGDETCEIAGVGPVPVAAVRAMFGDAAMAVVFRDAVDIRSVVHLGRQVTAHQRTALEARGAVCSVVGCGSTHQLEIDHTIGWSYTRVTDVADLDWLCSTDHALKSRRDLLAIGPPGARVLVARDPDDPTKPRTPLVQVRPAPPAGAPVGAGVDPPGARAGPAPAGAPPTLFDLAT